MKILKKDIVILFTTVEKRISQGTLYGALYRPKGEKKKICEKKKSFVVCDIFLAQYEYHKY